ncbi:MAG: carboxypeptidase-like regulatory domain-containing protein [Acidobacteria bacterium]|nr:carboxypeptidase-like regulatory domain-containing protein [Acidobacteriota bacterium]
MFLFFLSSGRTGLFAVDSASIWGEIRNDSGSPVTGALVTFFKDGGDQGYSVSSGGSGIFLLTGLPPGLYALHCKKDNFSPLYQEGIHLEPSATIHVTVTLNEGASNESSSARIISLDYSNNIHQTILDESTINDLPSAHDVWFLIENLDLSATTNRIDVAGLNGTTPALFSTRGGTSWTQTGYRLNGLDVGDPYLTGTPLIHPDFFSLAFIRTTNAGFPVQTISPGGEFNLITQTGMDRFHGTLQVYGLNALMQSNNISPALKAEGITESHKFNSLIDGNFQLSGPLVRNRLYYFTSVTAGKTSRDIAEFEEENLSSYISGLFSLNIVYDLGSLMLLWTGQMVTDDSFGADRRVPFTATTVNNSYSNVLQGIWNMRLSGSHALKIGLGYTWGRTDNDFQDESRLPYMADIFTGPISGSAPFSRHDGRDLLTFLLRGDGQFIFGGARHQLTYGVEAGKSNSAADTAVRGGMHLYYFDGSPREVMFFNTPSIHRESGLQVNGFIHDSLTFLDFFSFTFGLNASYVRGWIPDQPLPTTGAPISWFNLSPRIGAAVPLNKNRSAALKLSVARYFFRMPLSYLTYGHPNAQGGLVFNWNDANADGIFQSGEQGDLLRREGPYFGGIDPHLRRPFTDELVLSYVKTWAGWTFTLSGFIRETHNLAETVNTGVPFSAYTPVEIADDGDDRIFGTHDDLLFTVYNQNPDTLGNDFYWLTTDVEKNRINTYYGADLTLVKRYGKRVTFFLSLQAIQAEGTNSPGNTEWENDEGVIGTLYDNPNTLINATGRVRWDRGYTGRLGFNYLAPGDIRFAFVIKYYDGQPFTRKIIVTDFNQGPFYIMAHPRGVMRYEYNRTIEVRIEKIFRFGPSRFRIILDAFNIINRALATEENEWTRPEFPLRYATEIQSPRVFRLGLAFHF